MHGDVIKWKHFPRYRPFVRRIHRSPVNSPHKGQWHGAFVFSFDLRLNKRLSKQSWGWWFETSSRPLWRHCNRVKSSISPHGHCDYCDRNTVILSTSLEDLWPKSDLLNRNKIKLCSIKCARVCRLSQRLFLLTITRRHDKEARSALPALYEGNPMSTMQTFHGFFAGSLIKLMNKLSSCRLFDTLQRACEFTIMNGIMCDVGLSQNTHSVGASCNVHKYYGVNYVLSVVIGKWPE